MCGIAGACRVGVGPIPNLAGSLRAMDYLQRHRGPDGHGSWSHASEVVGLGHRRLSIIDIDGGAAADVHPAGNSITYNGEIYNYIELRQELGDDSFRTTSDTEVILAAYQRWGADCSAICGDVCVRDLGRPRRGLFARGTASASSPSTTRRSEASCISRPKPKRSCRLSTSPPTRGAEGISRVPVMPGGPDAVQGHQSAPARAHADGRQSDGFNPQSTGKSTYDVDHDHTAVYFEDKLRHALDESVRLHMRSDVPVGAYVSGGLDSSIVAARAQTIGGGALQGFTGRFDYGPEYDESRTRKHCAGRAGSTCSPARLASTILSTTCERSSSTSTIRRQVPAPFRNT